ncbi:MAG: DUF2007 domain-containing protein [Anaerolineae bacterium]|nr:DUF2007 domain-containing protein [Anaerolineae bacterium]
MSQQKWIMVTTVSGEMQAELMRGLLEAQEIPVMLMQESAGKVFGITNSPLGEVEILVSQSNFEAARDVIAKYYAGEFEGTEFSEE